MPDLSKCIEDLATRIDPEHDWLWNPSHCSIETQRLDEMYIARMNYGISHGKHVTSGIDLATAISRLDLVDTYQPYS